MILLRTSLKFRLSVMHLVLLAVLLVIFSYGIFTANRNFLIQTTAVRLRAQAKPVIENWRSRIEGRSTIDRDSARQLAVDLTSRDTAALVLDERGRILASGKQPGPEPDPVSPDETFFEKSLSGNNDITYEAETGEGRFLVALIPVRSSGGAPEVIGVVQLSTSMDGIYEILDKQKTMLELGILIILAAGAAAGYWITSRSLKDLTAMVKTCNKIAEGDLDTRINLPVRKDEIGAVASAFDDMISRIEDLFEAQTRFIASAAHELRTPLTAIQGSLEVLMRGAQDDPDSFRRLTQGMYREVTRLNRMCEQLLDLSRVKKNPEVSKERINLDVFFREFAQYAVMMAGDRELSFKGDPGVVISADPDSFKQILFNLVDNAVQHTSGKGRISVSWNKHDSFAVISVDDNGGGIKPEDLPRIFEPFYRGDTSRSRISGGTGLGLAIVKNLVDANGGEISISSTVNKGTLIEISFPSVKS